MTKARVGPARSCEPLCPWQALRLVAAGPPSQPATCFSRLLATPTDSARRSFWSRAASKAHGVRPAVGAPLGWILGLRVGARVGRCAVRNVGRFASVAVGRWLCLVVWLLAALVPVRKPASLAEAKRRSRV